MAKGEGPGAAAVRAAHDELDDLGLAGDGRALLPELVQMRYVLNAMVAMVFNPQIFMLFGIGSASVTRRSGKPPPPTRRSSSRCCAARPELPQHRRGLRAAVEPARRPRLSPPFFLESLFVTMGGAFGLVLFPAARNVGAFAQLKGHLDLDALLTVLLKVLVLPTFVANVAGSAHAPPSTRLRVLDAAGAASTPSSPRCRPTTWRR